MKSVIPFTKELDFKTKVREITSISLERDFEVENDSIQGNLYVSGEYKSHEVSVNVLPFSFKIPFTIEIPDHLDKDSISIEISDFAYDMVEDSKIKVNIELELEGTEQEVEEEPEEKTEVDSEEILKMLEESNQKDDEPVIEDALEDKEERNDEEGTETESEEPFVEEEPVRDETQEENLKESEEMILTSPKQDDEYTTYHIHMIKEGETVETICTMYNSNLALLGEYNDLTNITPGEKLIIPSDNE